MGFQKIQMKITDQNKTLKELNKNAYLQIYELQQITSKNEV
jgi:hypothetical protein